MTHIILITARDTACAHNLLPLEKPSHQSIIMKKCLLKNQVISLMPLKQLSLAQRNCLFLPQQEKKIYFYQQHQRCNQRNYFWFVLKKKKKIFAILVRGRENIPHKENSKISIKYNVEKEKREQTLNAISQFLGEFKNLFF